MQEWKSRNFTKFIKRLLFMSLILASISGVGLILISNKSKNRLRELNQFKRANQSHIDLVTSLENREPVVRFPNGVVSLKEDVEDSLESSLMTSDDFLEYMAINQEYMAINREYTAINRALMQSKVTVSYLTMAVTIFLSLAISLALAIFLYYAILLYYIASTDFQNIYSVKVLLNKILPLPEDYIAELEVLVRRWQRQGLSKNTVFLKAYLCLLNLLVVYFKCQIGNILFSFINRIG